MKTRTQKAALNTFSAAAAEIVSVVCGLILPRLILRNFGSTYNGITSSAKQFLSAVSILTMGISGATRVALYKSLAANDTKKTSGIIWATELYMRKVGFVLLGLMVVLTIFYPILVDTGYMWIQVAPLIVAAGISASGRYFFGTAYNALLSADQSVYVFRVFHIIANILNVLMSLILIKIGCNIQVVKLGSSLILLMNPLLRSIYVRKRYKLDRSVKPDNSAILLRGEVMAHSVANIIHSHTDIIVLTIFCDVKIVSVYTVYNMIMRLLNKTKEVFTRGTEAVYGNMWVKGELVKMKQSLGYYEYVITAFISVIFSTTLVLILPFVELYTKGVHDVNYLHPDYAIVIIMAQVFSALRTPYVAIVQGVGHYKQTRNGAIAEAAINLIISVAFVQVFGIVGVAIGTLAANMFRTIQYAFYIDNHLIKRGKHVFATKILWALANMVIVYLSCERMVTSYAASHWMLWIACGFLVTFFSLFITVISSLLFYRKDMQGVIEIGKRALTGKMRRKMSSKSAE